MFVKKLSVFFIILILVLPLISFNTVSSETETNNSPNRPFLLDALLYLRFRLGFLDQIGLGKYFVRQLRPPVPIQPYPDTVSLNYYNKTTFQIGGKDPITLEWVPMVKVGSGWDWGWMSSAMVFTFEFVPPENAEQDVFNVIFDPEKLVMRTNKENLNWPGAEQPFRTNVTIMLKSSVDPTFPTQDIVLKVNIVREETLDKFALLSAPKFPLTHREEYLEKADSIGIKPYWTPIFYLLYNRITKWPMIIGNMQFPNYDKWIDSTVEILVKVKPYHQIEIIPPLPLKIEPYQVKSIPVSIKNIGSHIDTFNFNVRCDDENMVVTAPPSLTLKPGEEGQALVGVAAPKDFVSVGSTTSIFVEAYSVDDPEKIFSNTIILSISGIQVGGGAVYTSIFFLIIIFILIALFLYLLKIRNEKICKKPDKPWKIPEEKKYLETLDDDEYKKIMKMMNDEYQSALSWYKYYLQAIFKTKKAEEAKRKIEEKKNKTEEKMKKTQDKMKKTQEKTKKLEAEKEIKKEKVVEIKKEEIPKIEEKIPEEIKKEQEKNLKEIEAEREKRRKERVILRIKREQEKQKRKFA